MTLFTHIKKTQEALRSCWQQLLAINLIMYIIHQIFTFNRMIFPPQTIAKQLITGQPYLLLAPFLISILITAIIILIPAAFIMMIVKNRTSEKTLLDNCSLAARILIPLVTTRILASFLILIGLLFFIIPGLVVFVLLFWAPFVVIYEGKINAEALKKSAQLMRRNASIFLSHTLVALLFGMIFIALTHRISVEATILTTLTLGITYQMVLFEGITRKKRV